MWEDKQKYWLPLDFLHRTEHRLDFKLRMKISSEKMKRKLGDFVKNEYLILLDTGEYQYCKHKTDFEC